MISKEPKHVLNGLVLAGGKSRRMGMDKSMINWHSVPQKYYMADILHELCDEVFISCREEQVYDTDNRYQTLTDAYMGIGPYGALLSAFKSAPGSAWLVTACDLPLLDAATLKYLITHRDRQAIATAYESPYDGLPEPLIAIWEPASYKVLLRLLEQGYTCPRKVLMQSHHVVILKASDPETLMNANTPADAEKARQMIYEKQIMYGK